MTRSLRFLIALTLLSTSVLRAEGDKPKAAKSPQGDKAVGAFWSGLLKARVQPKAWAADPKDAPGVKAAKETLGKGFGTLLRRCRWEDGRKSLRIEQVDKKGVGQIVIGRYVDSKNQYIGLVSPGPLQRIRIFFPDGQFQYKVTENRFAGKSDGAGVMLVPHKAHWLAVFPYKVNGMSLKAAHKQARPGDTVTVKVELTGTSEPGRHHFRFLAVGPKSKPLPGYPRIVPAPKGRATVSVKLPADAAGTYGFSARCVVTAAIAGDSVTVAKAPKGKD